MGFKDEDVHVDAKLQMSSNQGPKGFMILVGVFIAYKRNETALKFVTVNKRMCRSIVGIRPHLTDYFEVTKNKYDISKPRAPQYILLA